jgi:probable HAF family extracellular repeat protein
MRKKDGRRGLWLLGALLLIAAALFGVSAATQPASAAGGAGEIAFVPNPVVRAGLGLFRPVTVGVLPELSGAPAGVPTGASSSPTAIDLGTLGGSSSFAEALNARGQVVGISDTAVNGASHAFSWTKQGGMADLGTLGGNFSLAIAVNERGMAVGDASTADGSIHASSWTKQGGIVDLGTFGGSVAFANAVSENGQVVGTSGTPGDVSTHAFSWTKQSGMVDLGTIGGNFSSASGVNGRGQVVGDTTIVTIPPELMPSSGRDKAGWSTSARSEAARAALRQ